jgi:hypothetical protein
MHIITTVLLLSGKYVTDDIEMSQVLPPPIPRDKLIELAVKFVRSTLTPRDNYQLYSAHWHSRDSVLRIAQVYSVIASQPGCTAVEVATILGGKIKSATVVKYASELRKAGAIDVEVSPHRGGKYHYYLKSALAVPMPSPLTSDTVAIS